MRWGFLVYLEVWKQRLGAVTFMGSGGYSVWREGQEMRSPVGTHKPGALGAGTLCDFLSLRYISIF